MSAFSLPTQRCFRNGRVQQGRNELFSAYAEVFRIRSYTHPGRLTFLCLRRGVSLSIKKRDSDPAFSLPTQRCFLCLFNPKALPSLFSAYAEVFLQSQMLAIEKEPFLCLRRGVSVIARGCEVSVGFSLPTQRCFHP